MTNHHHREYLATKLDGYVWAAWHKPTRSPTTMVAYGPIFGTIEHDNGDVSFLPVYAGTTYSEKDK